MAKAISENDLQAASGGAKIVVYEEGFDVASSVPGNKTIFGSQTDEQWGNGETDSFLKSIGDTEGKKNFWTKNGIQLKGDTLEQAREYAKKNKISLK